MNLKVDRAFSCQITEERLYCACSDGILRIFKTESLAHIVTLSRPPPLGETNILSGISKIKIASNTKSKFADILSVKIDEKFERVVALYSDRMMFIWDVKQLDKANVFRTFMSHNGPIHDV
jgi:WD40 repeat protein